MRNPGGYGVAFGPDATHEHDTFTCGHCQFVVIVPAKTRDPADLGGLCKICMALVCPKCYGKNACTPWEKQMEVSEARDRFRREAGLA